MLGINPALTFCEDFRWQYLLRSKGKGSSMEAKDRKVNAEVALDFPGQGNYIPKAAPHSPTLGHANWSSNNKEMHSPQKQVGRDRQNLGQKYWKEFDREQNITENNFSFRVILVTCMRIFPSLNCNENHLGAPRFVRWLIKKRKRCTKRVMINEKLNGITQKIVLVFII